MRRGTLKARRWNVPYIRIASVASIKRSHGGRHCQTVEQDGRHDHKRDDGPEWSLPIELTVVEGIGKVVERTDAADPKEGDSKLFARCFCGA